MATTRIQIVRNAIAFLGEGSITTVSSGGQFATFAEDIYDLTISAVLAKDNWRFATAIIPLSRLESEPIVDEWKYIYQLPADYLSLIRLYPDNRDFQIYQNKLLYSNYSELKLEYRFKPDESRFPKYFEEYFTYYLSGRLALTAGISKEMIAILEKKEETSYKGAIAADGSSHPTISIKDAPYINVRGRG